MLSKNEFDGLVSMSDGLSVKRYIDNLSRWQYESRKQCRNPYQTLKNWIEADRLKGSSNGSVGRSDKKSESIDIKDRPSYDLEEWERYAMNRKLVPKSCEINPPSDEEIAELYYND